ncbi:MAG: hypothetical protein Q8K75_08320 [Chlamydiales bacterium]|nr:hypothetical protein [Chlamydiales bacterium]
MLESNENQEEASSPWKSTCDRFAELLATPLENMPPDPLNAQKRRSAVSALSIALSTDEFFELYISGIKALEHSDKEECKQLYTFLKDHPEDFEASIDGDLVDKVQDYAVNLLSEGNSAAALPYLGAILFLRQDSGDLWFKLALALYELERYPLAERAALTAARLLPQQPESSLFLGLCEKEIGHEDDMIRAREQAEELIKLNNIQLSPEWSELYESLKQ